MQSFLASGSVSSMNGDDRSKVMYLRRSTAKIV